jgi:DNA polymerase theta
LAEWINAQYFISTYRPVPVDEYLVYENAIYPAATSRQLLQTMAKLQSKSTSLGTLPVRDVATPEREIAASASKELSNPMTNAMVAMTIDTVIAGYGALVFCGSRVACQVQAALISEAMPDITAGVEDLNKRLDLLAELRSLPSGLDPALETTLIKGVGFHRKQLSGY